MANCSTCTALLNEALNLVVRARNMDSIDRRKTTLALSQDPDGWEKSGLFDEHVAYHNIISPHIPIATKSATLHLWVQDQYDRDLHEWEQKTRDHLTHSECRVV